MDARTLHGFQPPEHAPAHPVASRPVAVVAQVVGKGGPKPLPTSQHTKLARGDVAMLDEPRATQRFAESRRKPTS